MNLISPPKAGKFLAMAMVSIAIFSSCSLKNKTGQVPDALVSHIDSTVKPGDDFFLYANGKWFKQNPIPPSERSNGLWQLIQDTINAQIRNICETSAAIKTPEKGSNKQKIGDFFFTGMDSVTLNKKGISDLKPELDRIDGIKDMKGVSAMAAFIHQVAGSPLFSFFVGQDDKISNKYAVIISQGGLSLPERSFYFDTDPRAIMIREKFVEHAGNIFMMMGYDKKKATQAASKLMKLETSLARASRKLEDTRDPVKNYNKLSFKQLTEKTANFDWALFTETIGLKKVDSVIVGQPEFLEAMNSYLKTMSLQDWKDYLKFHFISGLAEYLDDKTYMEVFNFYSKTMQGVKEPKPRWKRVVEQTDNSLGELIGQVYVSEYLPKGTKEKLTEIGNAIREVYAERIKALDWMSEPTKQKALKKLSTVIMKVGYPDKWKDLSSLVLDRNSYVRNVIAANRWAVNYNISKYGKQVDRTEWNMTPQTYNAYYNPSNNEIVVPGSNIIVPGYERVLADDAILYSVIGGSTFGHEITHGFDDQGCKYDEAGNLHNWWTAEDSVKFYAKTRLIVEQFSEYNPVDSLHINGKMTQGENIADLAGITMGYVAFQKTKQYKEKLLVAGLNPDQRFFLAYALAWMINQRPEGIANQVKMDVHSPAKYRVIGPLSDITEFYTAFGLKEGDKMWRPEDKRVKIW
ncbi:MAG: M13 family metallopeptidase [Bacteroidetes bacterium]|nr:M13 family metallopeptidase [Bacteroidota bacterium]